MSLQDELRAALTPVVASLMEEFPSTVTVTRRVETLGAGNRTEWDDAPLANGTGATALLQPPTQRLVRAIYGRDATGDAVLIISDTVPLQSVDKVQVTAGPYAGHTFWVTQTTPGYMAGIVTALLTLKRPE